MSRFERRIPDAGNRVLNGRDRRQELVSDQRFLPSAPGVVPAPPAIDNSINQLLRVIDSATDLAGTLERKKQRENAEDRVRAASDAAMIAAEELPVIEEEVNSGRFDDIDASDAAAAAHGLIDSVVEKRNLDEATAKRLRQVLLPRLTQAFSARLRKQTESQRREIEARAKETAINSPNIDDVRAAVKLFREANPLASETDALANVVVPALEQAARSGDEEKFKKLTGILGDRMPEQRAAAAKILETVREQREAEELDTRLTEAASLRLDFQNGTITAEELDKRTRELFKDNPRILESQLARNRSIPEKNDFSNTKDLLAAAAIEANEQEFEELASKLPDTPENRLFIARQRDRLRAEIVERQRAITQVISTRIDNHIAQGDFDAAFSLVEASLGDGKIDEDTALKLQLKVRSEMVDFIDEQVIQQSRSNLVGEVAAALDAGPVGVMVTTLPPQIEVELPSGDVASIKRDDVINEAYQRTLAKKFGVDENGIPRNPLVELATTGNLDPEGISRQIELLEKGVHDETLSRVLEGQLASVRRGMSPDEVPDQVEAAVLAFAQLNANAPQIARSHAGDAIEQYRLIGMMTSTRRVGIKQAVSALANADPNVRSTTVSDKLVREAVDDISGKFKDESAYSIMRNMVITAKVLGNLDDEQAVKQAKKWFKEDVVNVNGYPFSFDPQISRAFGHLDKQQIKAGGELLSKFYASTGEASDVYDPKTISIRQNPFDGRIYLTSSDNITPIPDAPILTPEQFAAVIDLSTKANEVRAMRRSIENRKTGPSLLEKAVVGVGIASVIQPGPVSTRSLTIAADTLRNFEARAQKAASQKAKPIRELVGEDAVRLSESQAYLINEDDTLAAFEEWLQWYAFDARLEPPRKKLKRTATGERFQFN